MAGTREAQVETSIRSDNTGEDGKLEYFNYRTEETFLPHVQFTQLQKHKLHTTTLEQRVGVMLPNRQHPTMTN